MNCVNKCRMKMNRIIYNENEGKRGNENEMRESKNKIGEKQRERQKRAREQSELRASSERKLEDLSQD